MRKVLLLPLVIAVVPAAGCSTQIRASDTYDQVYRAARDAVLASGFEIEEWAKGAVGESPDTGRIDFHSIEEKDKFDPRRFVTLTIEPHGDAEVKERTLSLYGWRYGILSVPTAGLWKVHQSDIQRRAADAVRAALPQIDNP